jgi:hypothetical protein
MRAQSRLDDLPARLRTSVSGGVIARHQLAGRQMVAAPSHERDLRGRTANGTSPVTPPAMGHFFAVIAAGADPLRSASHNSGWWVRSERLKRDLRNAFRSRLHTHANGRGCSSQFYRFGFANPAEAGGMTRRQWPGTREHLYRLAL